mgnify:CR=1 FL=1
MKYKYIILLTMVFYSCGGDEPQASTTEPTPPTPEPKSTFEYKTYKRITPMNGIENEYLSRHADVEKVSREIMNIYDSKN